MIDLRSLDAFALIAKLGSFRAAADKLAVTQPVDDASLTCVPLGSYPLRWVAGAALDLPRGKLELARVAHWPIITHLRHTRTYGAVQDLLARDGVKEARVYTSSSISTTVTM